VSVLKLRQNNVSALPHVGHGAKHQCIYWDAALPCFGLRVYPSGRRVYVSSYRLRRRKRLASLGRADVLTLEQARKKAITYLGKMAANEDPQEELDQLRSQKSVAGCAWRSSRTTRRRNELPGKTTNRVLNAESFRSSRRVPRQPSSAPTSRPFTPRLLRSTRTPRIASSKWFARC
jgi:hypothetical protein